MEIKIWIPLIIIIFFPIFTDSLSACEERCYGYNCDTYCQCQDHECDDGNPCTNDYCRDYEVYENQLPPDICVHDKIPGCCIDDSECETCFICVSNQCQAKNCGECQYCDDTSGECIKYECCTASDCGYCQYCDIETHKCQDYECCSDTDCGYCEYCENHICYKHECCSDTECGYCEYCENHICYKHECCSDTDCGYDEICVNNQCIKLTCPECQYPDFHTCHEYECCSDTDCGYCEYCENHICYKHECCSSADCNNFKCYDNHKCSLTECDDSYVLCEGKCYPENAGICCFDIWREGGNCCSSEDCSYDEYCSAKYVCEKLNCSVCEAINNHECVPNKEMDGKTCATQLCPKNGCYNGIYQEFPDTCERKCNNGRCAYCVCNPLLELSTDKDNDGFNRECDGDCNDTDPNINPMALEICDSIDNDCDSIIDNILSAPYCDKNIGVCAGATKPCNGENRWKACDSSIYQAYAAKNGYIYVENETGDYCDGLDNDCDGLVDEYCPCSIPGDTEECGIDTGACQKGIRTCLDTGYWGMCVGDYIGPSAEICDNIDNDCDGLVDEDFIDKLGSACGKGICEGGVYICNDTDRRFIMCSTGNLATDEVCNSLDDDCDGRIDEDFDADMCRYICEIKHGVFSERMSGRNNFTGCCGDDRGESWCASGEFLCLNSTAIFSGDISAEACECITGKKYDPINGCCDSAGDNWCYSDRSAYCGAGNLTYDGDFSSDACKCITGTEYFFNRTDTGKPECCGDDINETWCGNDGICFNGSWYGWRSTKWCEICASADGDADMKSCWCKGGIWANITENPCCGDGPAEKESDEDYFWYSNDKGCCIKGSYQDYCDTIWCEENPVLCKWCEDIKDVFQCDASWCKQYENLCLYCKNNIDKNLNICNFCLYENSSELCSKCLKDSKCTIDWCFRNSYLCEFIYNTDYSDIKWCKDNIISCEELYNTMLHCQNILPDKTISINNPRNALDLYIKIINILRYLIIDKEIADNQNPDFSAIIDNFVKIEYDTSEIFYTWQGMIKAGIDYDISIGIELNDIFNSTFSLLRKLCKDNRTTFADKQLNILNQLSLLKSQFSRINLTTKLFSGDIIEKVINETITNIESGDLNKTKENLILLSNIFNETYGRIACLESANSISDILSEHVYDISSGNIDIQGLKLFLNDIGIPTGRIVPERVFYTQLVPEDIEIFLSLPDLKKDNLWLRQLESLSIANTSRIYIQSYRIEVDTNGKKKNVTVFTLSFRVKGDKTLSNVYLPLRLPEIITDISDVKFDLIPKIIEKDSLVLWKLDKLYPNKTYELKFVADTVLCRNGKECPKGKFCANMVNGIGMCKSSCKGCGTVCDTGKPWAEVCSGYGSCIRRYSYSKSSPCLCNDVCNTRYCNNGLCCGRIEFANPELGVCTIGKALLNSYRENIYIMLGEKKTYYLNIFNVYNNTLELEIDTIGLISEYIHVPDKIIIPKQQMKTLPVELFGAKTGMSTLNIRIRNEKNSIDQTLTLNIYVSTKTQPLGVEIKTATDLNIISLLILFYIALIYLNYMAGGKFEL